MIFHVGSKDWMETAVKDGTRKKEPKEDPWAFVFSRFYGLAVYYSNIYANMTKHRELFEDFRNEMLYWMVDAYQHNAHRPLHEIVKIIKTVPRNYYGSRLCAKEFRIVKVGLDVQIENIERFEMLYDKYYEKFLDEHYHLNEDASDEKMVLMEILYPSEAFQRFVQGAGLRINRGTLREYFKRKHKWTRGYFDDVFKNIKILEE